MVDNLTGGKLTVVETEAMVEQDFDVGGDDCATVFVDAVLLHQVAFSFCLHPGHFPAKNLRQAPQ